MTKARDLASASPAPSTVSATELGYLDGVTSGVQAQIDSKEPTLPSQTGNSGKYLTTDGSTKSWGTVSQYALPSQTGNSGKFLTTNGTSESWGTVNQPITWTQRTMSGNTNEESLRTIAYNGSNLYIAAGNAGFLYSSTNGTTWTLRTSGFGANSIRKVAYGNGLWVAVGQNGTITTSTDGTTWTARTSNMSTNQIIDVTYQNSLWVAVGDGGGTTNTGGIIYSTDGITWTRKSQSLTVGTSYYSVIWNGTNWVVGASPSTNNYLYASTPSGTWTAGASGSNTSLEQLYWDGTRMISVDSSGNARYSTSATVGTMTAISNGALRSTIGANYYYNGRMYASGQIIGTYSTSLDNNSPTDVKNYGLSPLCTVDPSGTFSGSGNLIWVGAAGIIVSGLGGKLWTSF